MRVFEDIKQRFEDYMSGEEFIRDNNCEKRGLKSRNKDIPLNISPEKLRVQFKWFKGQWRKLTDRVKTGSGKGPVRELEWYNIINPVFSEILKFVRRQMTSCQIPQVQIQI